MVKTMARPEKKERNMARQAKAVPKHDKKSKKIYAPVNGRLIPLADVKDPILSQKLLGEGVAFSFTEDLIFAPCQGTLIMISNSRHSMGIETENGDHILVHLGLDYENQHGQGYHLLVSRGQHVHVGQPLMRLDRKYLDSQKYDLTVALVVTNRAPSCYHVFNNERAVAGRAVVMEKIN